MGYLYAFLGGGLFFGALTYIYAARILAKAVELEREGVGYAEATFHRVLDRIKEAL